MSWRIAESGRLVVAGELFLETDFEPLQLPSELGIEQDLVTGQHDDRARDVFGRHWCRVSIFRREAASASA